MFLWYQNTMLCNHTDGANMKWNYFTFTIRLCSLLLCQVFNTTTLHGAKQEEKHVLYNPKELLLQVKLLLLPLAIQPTVSFGLSNNILPFFPITISLCLTPSTWRSLSTSSFHPFLGLPLRLVPSSSPVKIFLAILSSSILSSWPSQLILCPFIHFTTFSPLLISSSSRFVLLFHSPSSYLGPYILLNIFLSKSRRACSS